MITKDVKSAKSQAQRVRGDKKAVQSGVDSNGRRGIGQTSGEDGSQPLSDDRDDWTRGNIANQRGQRTAGGIVNRLIANIAHLVEQSKCRTAELEEQLTELQQLSTQLQETKESE